MMGQACHFNRYAVADVPYGKWRYTAESRRLHHVLDKQLVSYIVFRKPQGFKLIHM